MNKWQKVYIDKMYGGKIPTDGSLELLENVAETITVHIPKSQYWDASINTYTVTESDCDMPNGKIDVVTLVANLQLWVSRGYRIEY